MFSLNVFLFVLIGDHHVGAAGLQVDLIRLRTKTTRKIKGQETPDTQLHCFTEMKMWILTDSK